MHFLILSNLQTFLNMKSSKNSKVLYKYNKITQQKKFHLLNLVLGEKMLIKDAAKIVGINYSTAKTILFFNRNGDKSYQFQFQCPVQQDNVPLKLRTSIVDLSIKCEEGTQASATRNYIDIISTIGSVNQTIEKLRNAKILSSNSTSHKASHLKKIFGAEHSQIKEENSLDRKQGFQFDLTRPMTRSQAALLRSNKFCKVEQEAENSELSEEQSDIANL